MTPDDGKPERRIAPHESPAEDGASIPLMITRRQRAALRALGHTDEAVATMTPREAHALLRREASPDDDS